MEEKTENGSMTQKEDGRMRHRDLFGTDIIPDLFVWLYVSLSVFCLRSIAHVPPLEAQRKRYVSDLWGKTVRGYTRVWRPTFFFFHFSLVFFSFQNRNVSQKMVKRD